MLAKGMSGPDAVPAQVIVPAADPWWFEVPVEVPAHPMLPVALPCFGGTAGADPVADPTQEIVPTAWPRR